MERAELEVERTLALCLGLLVDLQREELSELGPALLGGQQVSLSLGISLGAVVLETVVRQSGGTIQAASFTPAFIVVGLFSALSLFIFMRLPQGAGDDLSGRTPPPDPVTVMRERA